MSNCSKIGISDFNIWAMDEGLDIVVISSDEFVDKTDSFYLKKDDGSTTQISYTDPSIQKLISKITDNCKIWEDALANKERNKAKVEKEFNVTLEPTTFVKRSCAQYRVIDNRDRGYLGTINSRGIVFILSELKAQVSNLVQKKAFSQGGGCDLIVDPAVEGILTYYRVNINRLTGDVTLPCGLNINYFGGPDTGGYNSKAELKYVDKEHFEFSYTEVDNDTGSVIVDIKNCKIE